MDKEGLTNLPMNGTVPLFKNELVFDCLGTLDELHSYLSLCKFKLDNTKLIEPCGKKQKINYRQMIFDLIDDVFLMGGAISQSSIMDTMKKQLSEERYANIKNHISEFSRYGSKQHDFVYTFGGEVACLLNISRTIARRAERLLVALNRKEKIENEYLLPYINKVSELLFLMSINMSPS